MINTDKTFTQDEATDLLKSLDLLSLTAEEIGLDKIALEKAAKGEDLKKAKTKIEDTDSDEESTDLEKGFDAKILGITQSSAALIKAQHAAFTKSLTDITSENKEANKTLLTKIVKQGRLIKALSKKIETFGEMPVDGVKSLVKSSDVIVIDKFTKQKQDDGFTVYNLTKADDVSSLKLHLLDRANLDDPENFNAKFAKGVQTLEISRGLEPSLVKALAEDKIHIIQ